MEIITLTPLDERKVIDAINYFYAQYYHQSLSKESALVYFAKWYENPRDDDMMDEYRDDV